MNLGVVARVDLRSATVLAPDGSEWSCRVRAAGIMDHKKRVRGGVVVGDEVEWEGESPGQGVLEAVLPRRNAFRRRATGREVHEQIVAANLDLVVAVASFAEPPLHPGVLDRLALAAHQGGIPLCLVLNKTDLAREGAIPPPVRLYRSLGYPVFPMSARTGEGFDAFAAAVRGRRALFVGHSGVGKSTLLDRLVPGLGVRIGEISAATGRGRHTTTAALLVRLADGTEIVDTPGFRSFAPWRATPEEVADSFPEVRARARECRFRDCRHDTEPGCAVRAGVAAGAMAEARYQSYLKLAAQAEEEVPS
jgi:ribosome biogenesis GTPase